MRDVAALRVELTQGGEDVGREGERAQGRAERAPAHEVGALDEEREAAGFRVRVSGRDLPHVESVPARLEELVAARAPRRDDHVGKARAWRAAEVAAARVSVRRAAGGSAVRHEAVHAPVGQERDGACGRSLVVREIRAGEIAARRIRRDEGRRRARRRPARRA